MLIYECGLYVTTAFQLLVIEVYFTFDCVNNIFDRDLSGANFLLLMLNTVAHLFKSFFGIFKLVWVDWTGYLKINWVDGVT